MREEESCRGRGSCREGEKGEEAGQAGGGAGGQRGAACRRVGRLRTDRLARRWCRETPCSPSSPPPIARAAVARPSRTSCPSWSSAIASASTTRRRSSMLDALRSQRHHEVEPSAFWATFGSTHVSFECRERTGWGGALRRLRRVAHRCCPKAAVWAQNRRQKGACWSRGRLLARRWPRVGGSVGLERQWRWRGPQWGPRGARAPKTGRNPVRLARGNR